MFSKWLDNLTAQPKAQCNDNWQVKSFKKRPTLEQVLSAVFCNANQFELTVKASGQHLCIAKNDHFVKSQTL